MPDYKTRVMEEHSALYVKIENLKRFICLRDYDELPEVDRSDLKEQLEYMEKYYKVLSRRVSRMCGNA